jgi:hypothetical protein
MSDVKFSCPRCDQHIECDELLSGSAATCPSCEMAIMIPEPTKRVVLPPLPGTEKLDPDRSLQSSPKRPTAGEQEDMQVGASELLHWRRTANKLGMLAFALGTLNVALGAFVFAGKVTPPPETPDYATMVSVLLGASLLIVGSGCFFKQAWSFYAILLLAYLIIGNAILDLVTGNKPAALAALIAMSMVRNGHLAVKLSRRVRPVQQRGRERTWRGVGASV